MQVVHVQLTFAGNSRSFPSQTIHSLKGSTLGNYRVGQRWVDTFSNLNISPTLSFRTLKLLHNMLTTYACNVRKIQLSIYRHYEKNIFLVKEIIKWLRGSALILYDKKNGKNAISQFLMNFPAYLHHLLDYLGSKPRKLKLWSHWIWLWNFCNALKYQSKLAALFINFSESPLLASLLLGGLSYELEKLMEYQLNKEKLSCKILKRSLKGYRSYKTFCKVSTHLWPTL